MWPLPWNNPRWTYWCITLWIICTHFCWQKGWTSRRHILLVLMSVMQRVVRIKVHVFTVLIFILLEMNLLKHLNIFSYSLIYCQEIYLKLFKNTTFGLVGARVTFFSNKHWKIFSIFFLTKTQTLSKKHLYFTKETFIIYSILLTEIQLQFTLI